MCKKNNKLLYSIALYLLLLLTNSVLHAQNPTTINSVLEGTIVDEITGLPLEGANIIIEGVTNQTTTNEKGQFVLRTGQKFPYNIIITFVGYEKKIVIANGSPIFVKLKPAANNLDDVVVVGYGTQRRKDFTGSLASVPSTLKEQPASSPDKLLQGAVSGVQVIQASGHPGAGVSVRVRGGTSINAGSEPLYVVDGFPIYNKIENGAAVNPLSALNASDIESIDVLKDASATAIYGSRGANGVVLITTKNARKSESSVTYDGFIGQQEVIRKIPLLNAEQWGRLKNDARIDAGKTPYYTEEQLLQLGNGTDWQDLAFQKALTQSHNISLLSGAEKTKISLGFNYFDQEGVVIHSGFQRYSGRLNLQHSLNKKFKVGAFLNGSLIKTKQAPPGVVQALLEMPPTVPLKDEEGNYTKVSEFETAIGNPVSTLINQTNEINVQRFLLSSYGEYELIKGLTAKMLFGTDIQNNTNNLYYPSVLLEGTPGGKASISSGGTINWLNENTINYKKNLNEDHQLDILAGFTQQQSTTKTHSSGSSDFVTDAFEYHNLGAGTVILAPGSSYSRWVLHSYLARLNYSFKQRYLLTLTVRADGSSRFGKNNKWGTFPSAAFAWDVTEETALALPKSITQLKLRLSAGLTGNQEIPEYRSLARAAYYRYNFEDRLVGGFAPNSYGNPDLSWEKTSQYNIGVDFGLFDNRITLVADAYYKRTTDLLLEVPLPFTSGIESAFQNYGSIENKGIELALQTRNFEGAFSWNTNIVFAANRNKVLSLGPGVKEFVPINPSNTARVSEIVRVGEPLGNFYGYVTDGIFQDGDDFSLSPTQNTRAGSQRYKDVNNDGKITQAGDVTIIGNSQPKFVAGITNSFKYRDFDLNIFFQTSYGNQIFSFTKALLEIGSGFTGTSATLLNRWTPTNTNTDVHRAIEDPSPTLSDRFVEDGSYLRLKNLALGYTLPASITSKAKIKKLRLYVSAQNLVTWTKYTGFDPEVSRNGQNALYSGFDYGGYPGVRTYLAGLSLTL
ncbi:MAG: TonB-dependent receptor [Niabella sp.]